MTETAVATPAPVAAPAPAADTASLISRDQTAKMLSLDQVAKNPDHVVRQLIRRGKIRAVKVGKYVMVDRQSVLDFVSSN